MLRDELLVGLERVRLCGATPVLLLGELLQALARRRDLRTVGVFRDELRV